MLAVAVGSNSECCYSGGADARIHSWKIPDLNMDPYDGYGEDSSPPPPQWGEHGAACSACDRGRTG